MEMRHTRRSGASVGDIFLMPRARDTAGQSGRALPAASLTNEWPAVRVSGGWWDLEGRLSFDGTGYGEAE
jgi:hypothetical protein